MNTSSHIIENNGFDGYIISGQLTIYNIVHSIHTYAIIIIIIIEIIKHTQKLLNYREEYIISMGHTIHCFMVFSEETVTLSI